MLALSTCEQTNKWKKKQKPTHRSEEITKQNDNKVNVTFWANNRNQIKRKKQNSRCN